MIKGAPRHHHRNAGFIRQQHAPVAHLPDESGVPRERGIVHWWQCRGVLDAQTDGNFFVETITPIEHNHCAGYGKRISVESTKPDNGAWSIRVSVRKGCGTHPA
jgi:hypothetical protein